MSNVITINPSRPKTTWVAIEKATNDIISEGVKPEKVMADATKTGKKFIMLFAPKNDKRYIF